MCQLIKTGCLERFVLLTTDWLDQVTWCWLNSKGLKSNLQCRRRRELDIGNCKCVTSETRQVKASMYLSLLSFPAEMALWALPFRWFSYRMVKFLLAWISGWQCGAELPIDLQWESLWSFVTKIPGLICFCSARTLSETQVQRISAGLATEPYLKQMDFLVYAVPVPVATCDRPGNTFPNRRGY